MFGLKVTSSSPSPTPILTLPLNVAAVADEAPLVKLLNSIVDPAAVVKVAGSPWMASAEIVPPAPRRVPRRQPDVAGQNVRPRHGDARRQPDVAGRGQLKTGRIHTAATTDDE